MRLIRCICSILLAVWLLPGFSAFGEEPVEDFTQQTQAAEEVISSTMRLMRTVGTVGLTDEAGTGLAVQEGMRLYSGQAISTGEKSRAGIGLDDSKAVTLGAESAAGIYREGRHLALSLEEGEMYFSVSQPLEENESFEIRTSTMVLGIRGTSGYVEGMGEEQCFVILTSGHAVITAATGEEQKINPGRCVTVTVTDDGTVFTTNLISPRDFPTLLLEGLSMDGSMLAQAEAQNGSGFRAEVIENALERALENGDLSQIAVLGELTQPAIIRENQIQPGGSEENNQGSDTARPDGAPADAGPSADPTYGYVPDRRGPFASAGG